MNSYGCVPIKFHLWAMKFDFHVTFHVMKYCFSFVVFFFNHLKMLKPSLACRLYKNSWQVKLACRMQFCKLLLEEEEALAKKFIDKNTQLALQAYTEQIKSCGEQIDVMNTLSNRVWTISQETNPVQLLQVMLGFCSTVDTGHHISSWLMWH